MIIYRVWNIFLNTNSLYYDSLGIIKAPLLGGICDSSVTAESKFYLYFPIS